MFDPNFKPSNYFTEKEIELLKQLFIPTHPHFSPQFDFEKFASSSVVESLEKATSDLQSNFIFHNINFFEMNMTLY